MKIVALNGSPRLMGNTSAAVTFILDEFEKMGFETEHIQMYGLILSPCNDCGSCAIRGDGRCIIEDDDMNVIMNSICEADGVILAAPSYHGGIPGQMKILLERIGMASSHDMRGNRLSHRTGAAIAVQGRDGGMGVYTQLTNFMLRNGMNVCGSSPLTILTGNKPGEVMNDKDGVRAIKGLAKNTADVILRTRS